MNPFRIAILSLTRRKLTAVIALISVTISVACCSLLFRSFILLESRFDSITKYGDAVVGAKASGMEIVLNSLNLEGEYPEFVPMALFNSLRQESINPGPYASSGIRHVVPFLYTAKFKDHKVIATDDAFLESPRSDQRILVTEGKWCSNPFELVVGSKLANLEGLQTGSEVEIVSWFGHHDGVNHKHNAKVTGILAETGYSWDYAVFTDLKTSEKLLEAVSDSANFSIWGTTVLNYYIAFISPGGSNQFQSLINERTVAQVAFVDLEINKIKELVSGNKTLGIVISSIIIFLSMLAVASLIIFRFDGMKVQIAVLRALGYSKKKITLWLFYEGIILAVIACLVSIIIDNSLFGIFHKMIYDDLSGLMYVSVPFYAAFPVWIAAILAVAFALIIPVFLIYKQDIHDALKGV